MQIIYYYWVYRIALFGKYSFTEPTAPDFTSRGQQQYIFIAVLRIAGIQLLPSALADKWGFFL